MKRITFFLIINIVFLSMSFATSKDISLTLQKGEKVWAGVIYDGHLMPFKENYKFNFYGVNRSNQVQPLLLTNFGQYVWSEEPYEFSVESNVIRISDPFNKVVTGKYGKNLRDAQRYVLNKYFRASGLMPDTLLFSAPQYNTWIELNYNHNQADILKYAKSIIDNGLPPGVFMIDDTWQEDYGLWDFHPGRFPNPKQMIDQLHDMGFKVMLWICPFVSADQKLIYYELKEKKALLLEKTTPSAIWETEQKPIMIEWWNGISAELDFSNSEAIKWFNTQLDRLVSKYNVDGFKFDAADFHFYPKNSLSKGGISPNKQAELFAQFGLRFPLNEYRACWKMGNQPLAQRLHDKNHTWEELEWLIPQIIVQSLSGYTFCCPDMIGGGNLFTFENNANLDQELIVRSAQCHALMPMMQFSVAPWRVLDKAHFNAVKKAVDIRTKYTSLILRLAKESALTGEPIVKNMEYVFPHHGYDGVVDQFMLGDSILVTPMIASGTSREVKLPKGDWIDEQGVKYNGGKAYIINVPLERLPYFTLISRSK